MLRSVNYWNSIRFTVESRIYLSFYINYLWFYYFTLEHQPHGPSLWHKLKLWDSGGSWRTALSRRGQKSISIRLGCAWLCESERGGRATGDGRRATGDGRRATGDGRRATGDGRRATGDGRRTRATASSLRERFDSLLARDRHAHWYESLMSAEQGVQSCVRAYVRDRIARICIFKCAHVTYSTLFFYILHSLYALGIIIRVKLLCTILLKNQRVFDGFEIKRDFYRRNLPQWHSRLHLS